MSKKEQIVKYFKPFPKWAVWMVVLGIPLLLAKGAGIILVGIGIFGLVSWSKRPSDAQMDAWTDEYIKGLQSKAMEKTGTDESELVGEPVTVTGPKFWDIAKATVAYRKGKDNVLRFTPIGVTVLNFTANQLISYSCALDLFTGYPINEGTDEYFYRDVVSVSTKTESTELVVSGQKMQLSSAETFKLTTSGGTSISVVLRDPKLIEMMGSGGNIPITRAEKAIQTVRKMLREKKGTTV